MPWYTLLGDPTLKLRTRYTLPPPEVVFSSDSENELAYDLVVAAERVEIPDLIKSSCQNPVLATPHFLINAFAFNEQDGNNFYKNKRFVFRIEASDGFSPTSVKTPGWRLNRESVGASSHYWIESPAGDRFLTANSNGFTSYTFPVA